MNNLVPRDVRNMNTDVPKRSEITARSMTSLEQEETMQFFLEFPQLLRNRMERYCHLSADLLEVHAEKLDWVELSRSQSVQWSEELILKFSARWD
jgi:hypothetical protein